MFSLFSHLHPDLPACLAGQQNFSPADYIPWWYAQQLMGWLPPARAQWLQQHFAQDFLPDRDGLRCTATNRIQLNALLQRVALALYEVGSIRHWRAETQTVRSSSGVACGELERSAFRPLGLTSQAIHLNAYTANGEFWIGRRAAHKPSEPNRLDTLVAGGMQEGESAWQTLRRESVEEAGLQAEVLANVQFAGTGLCQCAVKDGLHRETVFIFDVCVPEDWRPSNQDGEVAAFYLYRPNQIIEAVLAGEFGKDAGLITLDCLYRHQVAKTSVSSFCWQGEASPLALAVLGE